MKLINILLFLRTWGLPTVLLGALILGQRMGVGSNLLLQEPVLRLDAINSLSVCWAIICISVPTCYPIVQPIWNRITPIKGRTTLIEIDLVTALSAALGVSLFTIVFLSVSPISFPVLFGYVLFASLSSIAVGYGLSRWIHRIHSNSPQVPAVDEAPTQGESEARKEENFWRRRLSFLFAAITFNISTGLIILAILYLKTRQLQVDGLIECSIVTLIVMTIFGGITFKLGQKTLKLFRILISDHRVHNAVSYFTGFSLVTAVVVTLTVISTMMSDGINLPPVWTLGIAYLIVVSCFGLSAIVFAWARGHDSNDMHLDAAEVFA